MARAKSRLLTFRFFLGVETRIANLRAEKEQGAGLIRRDGVDRVWSDLRLRPDHVPSQAAFLERPDDVTGQIKFPPAQTVRGAARLRVVIVVIALAESAQPDPEIIFAVIGGVEIPVAERRHVTDRVHRPSKIVDDEHRYVEAPKQPGPAQGEIQKRGDTKMRQHIKVWALPQPAVPELPDIRGVAHRTIAEARRLAHQPHHVGVTKSVERAVNVLVRVRFQMVVAMVPDPRHRIAGKRDGRACGEEKFQPGRHLETAMGEIPVQIKRGADSAPKINGQHDREKGPFEARPDRDDAEDLKADQNNEKKEIEFVVLKHEADRDAARVHKGCESRRHLRCERGLAQDFISRASMSAHDSDKRCREEIGVTGFEPATCRRGDRSTGVGPVHRGHAWFCSRVLSSWRRSGWGNFRREAKSMEFRASSPSIRRNCGVEVDPSSLYRIRYNGDLFSHSSGHKQKTYCVLA